MKQLLYIGITIIMIFFKTQAHSNYEKVFHDFSIESIDGEIINLSEYKNKVVLFSVWLCRALPHETFLMKVPSRVSTTMRSPFSTCSGTFSSPCQGGWGG